MKLKIEKSDLHALLSKGQNIVEKRNTMPVLANILLEATDNQFSIYATDLEVSLTDQVNAEIEQPGRVAVGAKSFFDIVRELNDGPIELEKTENNWLRIKQNKSMFNLVGIPAEEYPVFPTYSTKDFIVISNDVLGDMIDKTSYSVSNDETRYHLNGVYFERQPDGGNSKYRMVATDGHRLSLIL